MSGDGHSEAFERYRQGIRYFEKNLPTKIYLLNEASLEVCHGQSMTAEELEELARLAFPGWEGGDG